MEPRIYTAGKIWHAGKFQTLRSLGYRVNARWIDYDENHPIVQDKRKLWQHCWEDVRDCDFVLLYCGDDEEEQRGALVEIGMAYGCNKPVYAANKCKSLRANAISDVAFTHHYLWQWLDSTNHIWAAVEARSRWMQSQAVAA